MNTNYPAETIGSIMTTAIPACLPSATRSDIFKLLSSNHWEDVHKIFIVDESQKLIGFVNLNQVVKQQSDVSVHDLLVPVEASLSPNSDQEKAIFIAIKNDLDTVPVIDKDGKLLGAVTAKSIIDIMHDEHVEDALIAVGVRRGKGMNMVRLASARILPVITHRAPWLIAGAVLGVGLGFISSLFEKPLEETIALAYFIPVVAFIADSVGAQSEAITVRALATLKLSYKNYLLREVVIGLALGIVLGLLGALGALVISQSIQVAIVVGVSLLIASGLASSLAAIVPIFFKSIGKDPALAAGPLATAIQDILSIIIYFAVALLVIG